MKIFEWHLATPVRYALRGGNDHLFALGTIKHHAGIYRCSPEQLYARRPLIAGYNRFFSDNGIRYLFVVAPDKETIVDEHLPLWVREKQKERSWIKLRQLLVEAHITFLDLEAEFRNYPDKENLYNKRVDLWHWNANGFYLANSYLEKILGIRNSVHREHRPLEEESAGPYGVELVPRRKNYYGDIKITHIPFTDERYQHAGACCTQNSGALSIFRDVENSLRVFAATDSYFFFLWRHCFQRTICFPAAGDEGIPLLSS